MGCDYSIEKNNKSQRKTKITTSDNHKSLHQHMNSGISLIIPNKREEQRYIREISSPIKEKGYSLKSFEILEKYSENLTYKTFRVLNRKLKCYQAMHVIQRESRYDMGILENMKAHYHKNIVNIHYYDCDENFIFIVTDLCPFNIFDSIFYFNAFSLEKLKRVINFFLLGVKHAYENSLNITNFDFTKIRVINEFGDTKLEFFDLSTIFDKSNTTLQEDIIITMRELAKIILIVLNSSKDIQFDDFSQSDNEMLIHSLYNSNKHLLDKDTLELIDELLNFDNKKITIDSIIGIPFFKEMKILKSSPILKSNRFFYTFYSNFYIIQSTIEYFHFNMYYTANFEAFQEMFQSFEYLDNNELKLSNIAYNIRKHLNIKYTQREMDDLIVLFNKANLTYYNCENFIKMLKSFDQQHSQIKLHKAFKFIDKGNNGRIEVEELKQLYNITSNSDCEAFVKNINEIVEQMGKKEQDSLTFNEFIYILQQL